MTLLDTIILLGRDGWHVSFQSDGEQHCVVLYHPGQAYVEGAREALPVLDLPHYYTTAEASEERIIAQLLALATKRRT